jgi:hypothetical protein
MPLLPGHSRRALVAATATLAAPVATAKKKKRKKNNKPPAPLAFAVATVGDPPVLAGAGWEFSIDGVFVHPASGDNGSFGQTVTVAVIAVGDQVRAQIAAFVQGEVSSLLAVLADQDVPANRVAVTLL